MSTYNLRPRGKKRKKFLRKRRNTLEESDSSDEEYIPPKKKRIKPKLVDNENTSNSDDTDKIRDEYFVLDRGPLIDAVTNRLKKIVPDLPKEGLNTAVKNAIKKVHDHIVEDYCHAKPNDTRWKVNLDKKEVKELEPVLKDIRSDMDKDIPSIASILRAKIPKGDKKKALRLYDILQNCEPFTEVYYKYCHNISKILAIEKELTNPEEVSKLEKEEEKLKKNIGSFNQDLKIKILQLDADERTKTRIYEMYLDLMSRSSADSDYSTLKQKVIWATNLPYRRMKMPEHLLKGKSPNEVDDYCSGVYHSLDEKLYGMGKVKEKILHVVNNRIYNPQTKAMVALKGKPGVGKTAVAKALAESMGLPFERISLGGMEDPSIFKGTDNSWVGASPSILLQILKKMKVANGIVLFDEIDKLGDGDVSSRGKLIQYALLHITDYIQNSEFQDLFLCEFTHDLSNIWFMFAMNDDRWLDSALRDRLDIIEVKPYTIPETIQIIQRHILPKSLEDVGLERDSVTITNTACEYFQFLLKTEMKENGLRPIEKKLYDIVSRINMLRSRLRDDGEQPKVKLSYSLPDFTGFPYVIKRKTIERLWTNNTTTKSEYVTMMFS